MSDEATSFVVRDVDPDDMRRFRAVLARRKVSMQAAVRDHIRAVAEDERRRERAEMIRAARTRPNRPSIDPAKLLAGLQADRDEWFGPSPA